MRSSIAIASVLLLISLARSADAQADPAFATNWPIQAIRADPTPGIVGEDNTIHVIAFNAGDADTTDLEIIVSYNDWGVTYMGWQEIGRSTIDSLDASNYAETTVSHVFENRGHVCLEAKYSSSGLGTGGNKVTWNDRTQINWEVVYADEDCYIHVPFGNGADEDIVVNGTEILCLINGTEVPCNDPYDTTGGGGGGGGGGGCDEMDVADGKRCCYNIFEDIVPCCWNDIPQDDGGDAELCCDGLNGTDHRVFCTANDPAAAGVRRSDSRETGRRLLQDADLDNFVENPPVLSGAPNMLAANSEQMAVVKVPEIAANGMVVVVNANMNGQPNNVMIQVVKTTIKDLFNEPMFCCIKSVRTRVILERMLVEAMEAWEAKDCKKAIKILRQLMQKMENLLCDLDREEKACIEKALLRLNDLARLISIRCCEADQAGPVIMEGDFFRRAGLYEAALLQYAQAC